MSAHTHWEELKLPMGATRVRFLRSAWAWATDWTTTRFNFREENNNGLHWRARS